MLASLLYVTSVLAVAPPPDKPEILPLRRLRLYETGVGYFERRGGVRPGSDLALPLPASHLDDALKSLVVLDASGDTRVQGVKFASSVSESGARAMAGLPRYDAIDDPDDPTSAVGYVDILRSLEGSRVEIRHGRARTVGTLMEVEGPFHPAKREGDDKTPEAGANLEPWHAVVVVDDSGAIHRVRTDALLSLRPVDDGTRGRLKVAAEALSEQSARKAHPLGVDVSSSGQLGLGYISEAPVWRTTYRVVLPDQGHAAQLQAWALIHNDTDEDWKNVGLELANGRPQSFLYPLAAPRYAYRELTGPEDDLSTVPQLATETVDKMWGDGDGGTLGLVGIGRGGGGTGEGSIGLGSVGLIGKGSGAITVGPRIGDLADLSQAEGQQSGSLFIYRVADPLDLQARHSALVPILQKSIEAESICWFPRGSGEALTGARLVNSTAQTLPGGVVSVFADGGFVGESALHRLKPKERQFIAFGIEQDVDLTRRVEKVSREAVKLTFANGSVSASLVVKRKHTLTLDNRSGRARKVYVALDVGRNAEIKGDVELDYDLDSDNALAALDVAGGATVTRALIIKTGAHESIDANDDARLRQLAEAPTIAKAQRELVSAALAHRRRAHTERKKLSELQSRLREERDELARLRADLEALGRVRLRGRVAKKTARQLLETEGRIDELRERIKVAAELVKEEVRLASAELVRLGERS